MSQYIIKKTNILHNGKVYGEGKTIELTDAEAKFLADYLTLVPDNSSAGKNNKNAQPTQNPPETQDNSNTNAPTAAQQATPAPANPVPTAQNNTGGNK